MTYKAARCKGAPPLERLWRGGTLQKSKEVDEHLTDLRRVLERARKYGLKMNPNKCAFGVSAGQFLGFIVHERGIEII